MRKTLRNWDKFEEKETANTDTSIPRSRVAFLPAIISKWDRMSYILLLKNWAPHRNQGGTVSGPASFKRVRTEPGQTREDHREAKITSSNWLFTATVGSQPD